VSHEPFVHWQSWLLWGVIGTLVLTVVTEGANGLRMTRMSIPYLLGTMFTPQRDRARLIGAGVHLLNGLVFAFLYIAAFHVMGGANWRRGLLLGALHAAVVVVVVMRLMPAFHPRMASEQQEPTTVRQLEPPGFLGLNYGVQTPVATVIAHLVYGLTLGAFYDE
jgi:hypothetical protein